MPVMGIWETDVPTPIQSSLVSRSLGHKPCSHEGVHTLKSPKTVGVHRPLNAVKCRAKTKSEVAERMHGWAFRVGVDDHSARDRVSPMSRKKKGAKSAAKAASAVLSGITPPAGNPPARSKKGKNKKKKGTDWLSILGKVASTGLEMAPMLLPALLARKGLAASPGGGMLTSAPLAQGSSLGTTAGILSLQPLMEGGKLVGVKLTSMDYLSAIAVGNDPLDAGDVILDFDLNPADTTGLFAKTWLQQQANLWGMYKTERMVFFFEPSAPATQQGLMVGCTFPDPNQRPSTSGADLVRVVRSTEGSGEGNVWAPWEFCWNGMPIMKYVQSDAADGLVDDPQWTSPGRALVIAAAPIDPDQALGDLYVLSETTFSVPTIESALGTSFFFSGEATGISEELPFGNPSGSTGTDGFTTPLVSNTIPPADVLVPSNRGPVVRYEVGTQTDNNGKSTFVGLPIGIHLIVVYADALGRNVNFHADSTNYQLIYYGVGTDDVTFALVSVTQFSQSQADGFLYFSVDVGSPTWPAPVAIVMTYVAPLSAVDRFASLRRLKNEARKVANLETQVEALTKAVASLLTSKVVAAEGPTEPAVPVAPASTSVSIPTSSLSIGEALWKVKTTPATRSSFTRIDGLQKV